MNYYKIVNFEKFQHFKDRHPTWIKLYPQIMDKYGDDGLINPIRQLPDGAFRLLVSMWMLASKCQKFLIPMDLDWIAEQTGSNTKYIPNLVDIKLISEVYQDDIKVIVPENREQSIEKEKEKTSRFAPPCLRDVKKFWEEKGFNNLIEAEKFFNYYESNGWKVGKNPMKSWKSAASGWHLRNNPNAVATKIIKPFTSYTEWYLEHEGIDNPRETYLKEKEAHDKQANG